ncbi:MAG: fibronectin type III domain-containing protein [Saprospiraceae bacterium]|nr:fibronectin type III domain-containing protein [Saprospiraceae bacterium]
MLILPDDMTFQYLRCVWLLPVLLLFFASNHVVAQCPRPELLSASLVTDSTAQLTWTDVGDEYQIELREANQPLSGTPTHFVNGAPPLLLSNLTPGQQYHFRVRVVCPDASFSDWSAPRSFATDLNNKRPCPLDFELRDTSCGSNQFFKIHVNNAPGSSLGNDVALRGVRIMLEHPWRSDLSAWLWSPDGTRVQIVGGLNASDKNIGDPAGNPCAQFVELTEQPGALPLSAAAEQDNFTGYYLPFQSFAPFANNQNPNGVWQIEICDNKTNDKGRLRLFQLVFAPTGCATVENLTVTNITESSADISWTQGTDSVIVEYGPAGFIPGTGSSAGNGGTIVALQEPIALPLPLAGLTTLTTYQVYVRRLCAPGVWGPNSAHARFFTNCPPTLLENFDDLPTCPAGCAAPCPLPGLWQNVPDDNYEWKVWTGPGLVFPTAGPPAASGGTGNYLYFRNACSPTGANGETAILRTLCVQVVASAGQPCHFSFDLYMNTTTGLMSNLALQISTDGGQNWTTLQSWSGNQGKRWRREYVSLAAFDAQIAVFQFVATGVFGSYGDIGIDNLAFYGSTVDGEPDYSFFLDADGDGFGDPERRVILCTPNAPPGYVPNDGDCDDDDADIYPGATEILCNGVDENCNGMDDDTFIATPTGNGAVVCAGETIVLTANGAPVGQFFWFDNVGSHAPIGTGSTLTLASLAQTKTFYLQDSLPGANCASIRTPVTATVNPTPALSSTPLPPVCLGQSVNLSNATTDTANAGGTASYYFALPLTMGNQLSSPFIVPNASATYYVLNQTSLGCADTAAVAVTVNPLPTVQIAQGDSVTVCRGKSITLNANGNGPSPLSYTWSNGLNLQNIPVQASATPGTTTTYTVTVTDGNSCSSSKSIKVHTLNNVTQTAIQSVQNPSVCGGMDGSITLEPLNGTPPYAFTWSGPAAGTLTDITGLGTITGLQQGGYRVTVTDASGGGCSMVMPQIVLNAPGFSVEVDEILHIQCPGQNTGSITLSVNGTNPAISWNTGQITPTISSLPPGTYSVTITDGACSQVLSNLEITAPPPLQLVLNNLTNVACNGANSGAIDLAIFGATPPYSFVWSNAATTEDLANLAPGDYTATVTDANGCSFTTDVYNISEPPPLVVSEGIIQDILCFGENTGTISIETAGGVLPYQFLWSNGATQNSLNNLPAGNYSATVTDANGCSDTFVTTLSQPAALALDDVLTTHPICVGAQDGRIEALVSGGTPPYLFDWSHGPSGVGLNILESQTNGHYGLTVTDAAGCSVATTDITLNAPQLLTLTVNDFVPADCFGASTGRISVEVSGTQGSVNVTWNGQAGGFTLADVPAGQYIVKVQDGRGCSIEQTFWLAQPELPLTSTLLSLQHVTCADEPNGSITINTSGGTTSYSYSWSNGAITKNLLAIKAGSYTLTTTDAKGCTHILGPLVVTQPPALTIEPNITDIPCIGLSLGSIELNVTGGVPPYQYVWSNGAVTQNIYDLNAGQYSVTVQDASGCVKVLSDLNVIDRKQSFTVRTLEVKPVSCPGADDGRIVVQVVNGSGPFQFAWSPPVGLHPNIPNPTDQANNLSGGIYTVTVTDAQGCVAISPPYTIEEAPPVVFNIVNQINVLCKDDSTGVIQTAFSGGLPPFAFLWNNGATSQNLEHLSAGIYRLTITDFFGCTYISPNVNITQPALGLQITTDSVRQDRCGDSGGAIFLKVAGGTAPYSFLWNSGQQTASITGLAAGQYQLTATDHVGCTQVSLLYDIEALSTPLGVDWVKTDVACRGGNTGAISVQAFGGTPEYQFFWNTGHIGPHLTNLTAGTYSLTLTDAAGCFKFFTFIVVEPPLLLFSWTTDSSANGWSITLNVPPFYAVEWSPNTGGQTGPVATGLSAGIYYATVTDLLGCTQVVGPIAVGTLHTGAPEMISSLALFPNPTFGKATLDVELEQPAALEVALFNSLGQLVFLKKTDAHRERHTVALELEALPPSGYWVKISLASGEAKILRLIKL